MMEGVDLVAAPAVAAIDAKDQRTRPALDKHQRAASAAAVVDLQCQQGVDPDDVEALATVPLGRERNQLGRPPSALG
ncbi:hypothetical protein [Accumulibacter sp.]|uniref:hypothetical protein n=1 Tax=Accumulibacter sp. TaxID=2053492 RepID=UPI0025F7C3DD|nr:hypothetical protein [Accumulibacter sp.]MCM8612847.1 hypothetical protein [Accumulibacter sp.]MCM8636783.1 hypothetical protein [Accumulibacter sp.]MCM8641949.1 hypothetical protein [Accumulibacter sp.]